MKNFIKGLELNELFYKEVVAPILNTKIPTVHYSAGLLGWGSDVLGYDDTQSADHNWGVRFQIFLSQKELKKSRKAVIEVLENYLPTEFRGYPIAFEIAVNKDQRGAASSGNFNIDVESVEDLFSRYLGCNPFDDIKPVDWLTFSEHKLLAVTSGKIFHDGLGEMEFVRKKFSYYPQDVWLYMIAAQWIKIFEQQAFVGRCGYVGDDLGSMLIATRQVKNLMQICFLFERKYAPYSKWFGTAFSQLDCAQKLNPIFKKIIQAKDWKKRQLFLAKAYKLIAQMHDALGITSPLKKTFTKNDGRNYLVIADESFVQELFDNLNEKDVKNIKHSLGSINQFVDSSDQINNLYLCKKFKDLYI